MSGQPRSLNTWDDNIEYQMERGLTADEIVDAFDQGYVRGQMATRSGEWHDWKYLHSRRRILALITSIYGAASGWKPGRIASAADVLAMRRQLLSAGQQAGERSIASALNVHESTIHRVRVDNGLIPWPKD